MSYVGRFFAGSGKPLIFVSAAAGVLALVALEWILVRAAAWLGGFLVWAAGESRGETVQEHETYRLSPNVFLRLPFGKSVIFRRFELATIANHAHLLSWDEKEKLERDPHPVPVLVIKPSVRTVSQIINEIKCDLIECDRQTQEALTISAMPNHGNVTVEDIEI
jgi:hypothetical protein